MALTHLDAHHAARREAAGGHELHRAEPLVLSNTAGRLTRDDCRRVLVRCARAAGLTAPQTVTPHVLRATFATVARTLGVSLWDLQEAMDHRGPRTTQGYNKATRRLHHAPTHRITNALLGEDNINGLGWNDRTLELRESGSLELLPRLYIVDSQRFGGASGAGG